MVYLFFERDLRSDIEITQHVYEKKLVGDVHVNPKRFLGVVIKQ